MSTGTHVTHKFITAQVHGTFCFIFTFFVLFKVLVDWLEIFSLFCTLCQTYVLGGASRSGHGAILEGRGELRTDQRRRGERGEKGERGRQAWWERVEKKKTKQRGGGGGRRVVRDARKARKARKAKWVWHWWGIGDGGGKGYFQVYFNSFIFLTCSFSPATKGHFDLEAKGVGAKTTQRRHPTQTCATDGPATTKALLAVTANTT